MSDDLEDAPLYVHVADVLGCKPEPFVSVGRGADLTTPDAWACHCPGSNNGKAHGSILGVYRYDTDWAVMGPIIEQRRMQLIPKTNFWEAWLNKTDFGGDCKTGPTPLIAACRLLVWLVKRKDVE